MKSLLSIVICIAGLGVMGPILANRMSAINSDKERQPYEEASPQTHIVFESIGTDLIEDIARDNPASAVQIIDWELDRIDGLREFFDTNSNELFEQYDELLADSKMTETEYLYLAHQASLDDRNSDFSFKNMGAIGTQLRNERFLLTNILQEYSWKKRDFLASRRNYIRFIQIRSLLTRESDDGDSNFFEIEPNTTFTISSPEIEELPPAKAIESKPISKADSTPVKPSVAVVKGLSQLKGELLWPVVGKVKDGYGLKTGQNGTGIRNPGIEIATAPGARVRAVQSGEVSDIFSLPRYGKIVIIDHETFSSALHQAVNYS